MQIGVAGPGVAVGERGRDSPARLDLTGTVTPLAREQHLSLDEGQRIEDGGVVRLLDHPGDLGGRNRPQRRHRLHRRERQVETGHCRLARPGVASQRIRQLPGVLRLPAVLGHEAFPGDLGTHAGEDVVRRPRPARGPHARGDLGIEAIDAGVVVDLVRRAERLARDRVRTRAEQVLHLHGRHHIAGLQAVDTDEP